MGELLPIAFCFLVFVRYRQNGAGKFVENFGCMIPYRMYNGNYSKAIANNINRILAVLYLVYTR